MSALRIARPGLPVVLIDQGPSVARKTFSRYGIRGGGTMVTGAKRWTQSLPTAPIVDRSARKNPDNGGVQAPITEVHP